jgi:hypothetical protein
MHPSVEVCSYCHDIIELEAQLAWCVPGSHEVPRTSLFRGEEETRTCNACHLQGLSFGSPRLGGVAGGSGGGSRDGSPSGRASPTQRQLSTQAENLKVPDPLLNTDDPNWQNNPALTDTDWQYVLDFHQALEQEQMEYCVRCGEKWFNMQLNEENVCARCIRVENKRNDNTEPFLYGAGNNMDPGSQATSTMAFLPLYKLKRC